MLFLKRALIILTWKRNDIKYKEIKIRQLYQEQTWTIMIPKTDLIKKVYLLNFAVTFKKNDNYVRGL